MKTIAASTNSASPMSEAAVLIDNLRSQASTLLTAVLGQNPLVSFAVGSAGNFPYYWQNTSTLVFNATTYNWINHNLKANATPAQLDSDYFTTYFIEALSAITYSLSSADVIALNNAKSNATNQQVAMLNLWQSTYGSLPTPVPPLQPIDAIMNTIATTWAVPATTLYDIQQAPNLRKLLNNTPASGQPILPVLAAYLNAIGSSVSLLNAVTMNNGYLQTALSNVQAPTSTNGGLPVDSKPAQVQPAYTITSPLNLTDLINSLNSPSSTNKVSATLSVARSSSSEVTVSISGGTSFSIPILDFFSLGVSGNASYFSDSIATSSNSISIQMDFTGLTLVNYGPASFNPSTGMYWQWMQPITEALTNGTSDVSGFKFSPMPDIDFSHTGPFGLLTGVAISNYPTVTIKIQSADFQSIATTITQSVTVNASFLGIPLGSSTESTYQHSATVDASSSTVTITLQAPPVTLAGSNENSQAWVLGAQTSYPAAKPAFIAERLLASKASPTTE